MVKKENFSRAHMITARAHEITSRAHVTTSRARDNSGSHVTTSRVHVISPFRPIHAQALHVCVHDIHIHVVERSQRNTSLGQPWTNCVEINKL